jgi:hypothetical protein
LCLPTAPELPLWRNGDFGTSPLLLGSSRTSRCLPVLDYVGCRNVKHNGGPRNYALIRFDDGVVSVVVQVSDFIQTALDYRT